VNLNERAQIFGNKRSLFYKPLKCIYSRTLHPAPKTNCVSKRFMHMPLIPRHDSEYALSTSAMNPWGESETMCVQPCFGSVRKIRMSGAYQYSTTLHSRQDSTRPVHTAMGPFMDHITRGNVNTKVNSQYYKSGTAKIRYHNFRAGSYTITQHNNTIIRHKRSQHVLTTAF
jgi:hypothetical protein